ncbi:MAG: FIG00995613: hypothetical protein, partial [uncultured Nocardioidaceae bacterium]
GFSRQAAQRRGARGAAHPDPRQGAPGRAAEAARDGVRGDPADHAGQPRGRRGRTAHRPPGRGGGGRRPPAGAARGAAVPAVVHDDVHLHRPPLHPAFRGGGQGGADDPAEPDQWRRLRDGRGRPGVRLRDPGGVRRERERCRAAPRHPPRRGGAADRRRAAAPAHPRGPAARQPQRRRDL